MFNFLKKNKENQVVENKEESESFFSKAFSKTFSSIKNIVPQKKEKISFEEIEEILIEADVEYEIIEKAMNGLPSMISRKELRHRLVMLFEHAPDVDFSNISKPYVRLIIGVNGAGKTTTIAKLASKLKKEGQSVILGAGDTFIAASIEQLTLWANLNNELKKIVKVCEKALENRPYQKLMILDGTQGNSAIAQAKAFNEIVGIDGIIVTKLDGTAKGGALFSISNQLELPIFYIGVGEKQDDLIEFSPDYFVDSLLDEIYIKD